MRMAGSGPPDGRPRIRDDIGNQGQIQVKQYDFERSHRSETTACALPLQATAA